MTAKAEFLPRDGAGAIVYNGRMWLIGGYNHLDKEHFPARCANDVWSSGDGLSWRVEKPNTFGLASFDAARDWEGRHTAGYVVFQDKMWIVGGDPIQGHYQADVWNSADGKSWTHVNPDQPVPWGPRALQHTLVFQDKIWVMGGQTTPQFAPAEERFHDDIWNSADGVQWRQVVPETPHWAPRGMIGGSVVFNDRMWILGGGTYDTPERPARLFYNDVWSSADGVAWTRHVEFAPWTPRQYHEVAVFDGQMWVLEGWNLSNRNDVWRSADGVHWQELADTPWKPRHAASVFVHDNALWVVAGNNMESDVWRLDRVKKGGETRPAAAPVSTPIAEVLRQPLAPETLRCVREGDVFVVSGSTFTYSVDTRTGGIANFEAAREGKAVVTAREPAELWVDNLALSQGTGTTRILQADSSQVQLMTEGQLTDTVAYTAQSMFYGDGVAVSEITLTPREDLTIRQGIRHEVHAEGRFGQYLHKRRDTNGMDCLKGAIPAPGKTASLTTLTSCLEVFSHEAALAIFTDRGGAHRSSSEMETAALKVEGASSADASVTLTQHLVNIAPGGTPYVLPADEAFTFRIGYALAPNRLPHPRWRDLRMFIWVGDGKHPYPTDEEIRGTARLGFNLFQMHRLGTPGVPRPPAGELERVLSTVHEAGMLFLWTANADLMYASAPKVAQLMEADQWTQWQGFNYGGRYTAAMDPYCDLVATCLASPNGLAEYRLETIENMLDQYPVDGMYIDDNLAYENCTLWREHGHPEQLYDSLIELHDMSWRRRKLLLSKIPHAVLIDHCSQGLVLPVISAFDSHLFGEGYSFPSVDTYWDTFGSVRNMYAQGCLWAGDTETTRCGTEIAYGFDLLTGGGQYSYLDWRLWPDKFPYAAGVNSHERLFVETYNLVQYNFGMYESDAYLYAESNDRFKATTPGTYASLYQNRVWGDSLLVLANMNDQAAASSIVFEGAALPPLDANSPVLLFDVNQRTIKVAQGGELADAFRGIGLKPHQMKTYYLRAVPDDTARHVWGGKRITEEWDRNTGTLRVALQGPAGLEAPVFLHTGSGIVQRVFVDGKTADFRLDAQAGAVHGNVQFGRQPLRLEAIFASGGISPLPHAALTPDDLSTNYYGE